MKSGSRLHCLLLVWLFNAVAFASESDYTVEIGAGKVDCFYQPITDEKLTAMEIDYQVIDGGDLDINFLLLNPQSVRLATESRKMDGNHRVEFNGLMGDYSLCFDNTFSRNSKKVVFFEIYLMDAEGNSDDVPYSELAGDRVIQEISMKLEDVRESAQRVKMLMNRMERDQSMLRSAEARDRAVMEANYARVNFWSLLNLCTLLLVLLIQVYMVRSLFEERSTVGRLLRKGKL